MGEKEDPNPATALNPKINPAAATIIPMSSNDSPVPSKIAICLRSPMPDPFSVMLVSQVAATVWSPARYWFIRKRKGFLINTQFLSHEV